MIDPRQIVELINRTDIAEEDVASFLRNPGFWRKNRAIDPKIAQEFWQGVWNELGIAVTVPIFPHLSDKQAESLSKFCLLPVYMPALSESDYPACFKKPDWDSCGVDARRYDLEERWIAVETIAKPRWDDPKGYPSDRLMAAINVKKRFYTRFCGVELNWNALTEVTGFAKNKIETPNVEEWVFCANLFNWLRGHRSLDLPDLGSTYSWEITGNACGYISMIDGVRNRLVVGNGLNRLSVIGRDRNYVQQDEVGFRLIFAL